MQKIVGEIDLPGDKSISHRAALFSGMRDGLSAFKNFNFNRDCSATLKILHSLGVRYQASGGELKISGLPVERWKKPSAILDAENSGTTARLLSGILAGLPFPTRLTGDHSLCRRPMQRILDPLGRMGARIDSHNGYLPLTVEPVGHLHGITYRLPVASAQVKSAVLLAGLFADGRTEVVESKISRDHTERMLGLEKVRNDDGTTSIFSSAEDDIPDCSMTIPGDISSAAFFLAAALLLPNSELTVRNVSLNPTRTGILRVLQSMGARIESVQTADYPEPAGNLHISFSPLRNVAVNGEIVPNIIDEIPILALIASQSEGRFVLSDARELRYKESDRLQAISQNMRAVGIELEETDDGIIIEGPQKINGGKITTHGDHRIAMTFAIADLLTDQRVELDNADCVAVSFPGFFEILTQILEG